jgi:hypothetical protein
LGDWLNPSDGEEESSKSESVPASTSTLASATSNTSNVSDAFDDLFNK